MLFPVLSGPLRSPLQPLLGVRPRGGGLEPPSADLAAWFRKGVGITSSAGAVSVWADQSGNTGRNLAQATGAAQPALQGDGTILFNGTSHLLKTAAFTLNQPETVYLRMKQVTWTNVDWIFDGLGYDVGQLIQAGATPNVELSANAGGLSSTDLAVDAWSSVVCVLNGAASLIQVDAATVNAGATIGTGSMGGFALGARFDGTQFGNIQVAEVLIYSVAHDATQRAQVIAYLATL